MNLRPVALLVLINMVAVAAAAAAAEEPKLTSSQRKVEIVAHRGESYDAPENTLASFNLAWKRGAADGVELDWHLTSDGKLITSHDKDTFRTTGGKEHGGTKLVIVEHTAEELQKLDVGKWKGEQFAGEHMPLAAEVLATIPRDQSNRRLFCEIKVGPESTEPLAAAFKAAGYPAAQTCVISFHLDTCASVKKRLPEIKVYYLAVFKEDKKTGKRPPTIDELIKQAKDANLDGLDLSFKSPLDADSVKRIHDAGLKCYVWTVDDPSVAKQMIDIGVDGITTNRAAWLREQLGLPPLGK
jgi:glycerophosphoryl diester phosphodiesterase